VLRDLDKTHFLSEDDARHIKRRLSSGSALSYIPITVAMIEEILAASTVYEEYDAVDRYLRSNARQDAYAITLFRTHEFLDPDNYLLLCIDSTSRTQFAALPQAVLVDSETTYRLLYPQMVSKAERPITKWLLSKPSKDGAEGEYAGAEGEYAGEEGEYAGEEGEYAGVLAGEEGEYAGEEGEYAGEEGEYAGEEGEYAGEYAGEEGENSTTGTGSSTSARGYIGAVGSACPSSRGSGENKAVSCEHPKNTC
jgi:hypothetical protein